MLYGLKKIGVMGGHGDGANAIPSQFATTPILKAYREGTAMRMLSDAIAAIPGIVNLRTEPNDVPWPERAVRARKAGVDLCVELHTNWSLNRAGQPNSNVFVVIVPKYNPVHNTDAQKAMATQLFKPLADAMGMEFEIRTKKGSGEWDYYSFINFCNREGVPYPFIVEHGYHIDYAPKEELFKRLIVSRWAEIAEQSVPGNLPDEPTAPVVVDETEPHSYIVHGGAFLSKENGADELEKVKAAGWSTAYWWKNSDGVYHVRTGRFNVLANAMREAERLAALGLQAGVTII